MNDKPKTRYSMADIIGIASAAFFMPLFYDKGLGAIPVILIYLGIYWIAKNIANYIIIKRSAK